MTAHFTLTFYWWWLGAYLGVGMLIYWPMEFFAHRQIAYPPPFWKMYRQALRHRPWAPLLAIGCWPVALWELFS